MKWDSIAREQKHKDLWPIALLIELISPIPEVNSVTYLLTIFAFEQKYTAEQNQYGLISMNNNHIHIKLHVSCKQSALLHSSLQRIIPVH